MKTTEPLALLLSILAICYISGCGEPGADVPEIPTVPSVEEVSDSDAPNSSGAQTPAGGVRNYDGVSFQIPDDWSPTEAKMVDSKYVKSTDEGDIEITLTSMGGGIDANLSRWAKQMRQEPGDSPKESAITLDGVEAKMIDVRGIYNSRVGNQTVAKNSRLIGIALPIRPSEFYVRLVGPRDAVAGYYDEFRAFLKTAEVD